MYENILPEFFINEIFSLEKFPNYVHIYHIVKIFGQQNFGESLLVDFLYVMKHC